MYRTILTLAMILFGTISPARAAETKPPNILVILADDKDCNVVDEVVRSRRISGERRKIAVGCDQAKLRAIQRD